MSGHPLRIEPRFHAPSRAVFDAWLCSDAASFVLGHAMVVDGGQTT